MGRVCRGWCWDWSRLAFERPIAHDARDFSILACARQPCRQHTLCPQSTRSASQDGSSMSDVADVSAVERRWQDTPILCVQYMKLRARVRFAMAAARGKVAVARSERVPDSVLSLARSWPQTGHCLIRPLWVCVGVRATLQRWLARRRGWSPACSLQVCSRISRCVGACGIETVLSRMAFDHIRVPVSALAPARARRYRDECQATIGGATRRIWEACGSR